MTEQVIADVKQWIAEAEQLIIERLLTPLQVEEKTSQADVVTNVDKEVEAFFVKKITTHYPQDGILGEEGMAEPVTSMDGRVWIIDPIDGTLNFAKQQDHYCMMLALYDNQQPVVGFIYDVPRRELLWGGPSMGVYFNDKAITEVNPDKLSDGIISVNTHMFVDNRYRVREIAMDALAVRMTGCAGIGFKEVILGKQNAYISMLAPWDYAPGMAIAAGLGIKTTPLNGKPFTFKERVPVLVAAENTHQEIEKYL
ncbi:inositol monophosphatase family protein [Vagococcus lutrae]|uniref:inositol monophosphatase family protein n=1 Tax=Vagococcus lutrae TaxID=81947 RepID=UPI0023A9F7C1|nr:inositol monophosphatase family protein [Vagococcus lutrae]WEB81204.1 inositol monophosphatase family protein [Vagococcus lutrae]